MTIIIIIKICNFNDSANEKKNDEMIFKLYGEVTSPYCTLNHGHIVNIRKEANK